MLKRQKIQADSLAALDEKTNELLIKNAQNTVNQSKMVAAMAAKSSIKVETGFAFLADERKNNIA